MVVRLKAQVVARDAALAETRNVAAVREQKLGTQLRRSGAELVKMTQNLNSIKNSKSWRILSAALHPARTVRSLIGSMSLKKRPDRALIIASGFFDRDWYLAQYPDVKKDRADPALHYLLFGAFEGHNPLMRSTMT